MPNIVPGVVWQPVPVGNRAARRKGRGLVGHVAVSSAKNLPPGPLPSRSSDWHFYLPKEGPAIQYIDLDLQCWATGAGNASLAAFESEGGLGTAAQVNAEPWTENQLNWAARILRHMHDTEGVPLRVMESSASSERGFGTHRLGVPGYMAAGGEQWSSARGKLCPGDAKHAQRFEIVRRASGDIEEDDMFDDKVRGGQLDELVRRVRSMHVGNYLPIGPEIPKHKDVPPWEQGGNLNWLDVKLAQALAPLQGQLAGLTEALTQVAGRTGQAVDLEAVRAAAKAGAEEALAAGVDVDVTVGGNSNKA